VGIPTNPYDNLDPDRRAVFDEIPGRDYFDTDFDERYAETLFAIGFGYTAEEYDGMGLDADAVHAAREDFFDFMGLEWEDFPWDEWREAMGYDE
jgi:hypothetical protein